MKRKVVKAARGWAPQKNKKIHGMPERYAFIFVLCLAVLIISLAFFH